MRLVDRFILLFAVLALWQLGHVLAGATALASPAETLVRLWVLAARPAFRADAASTALAFLAAAALAVTGGVLAGALLGVNRLLGRVVEPFLASFYALPKVTLYPLVLLLFGLGLSAKVAFGVMHGFVPLALLTMNAVLQVRPVHLRAARALRLSRTQQLRHVVWPSARPDIAAGIRICVPLALLGVLIGEMFASRTGLGAVAMRAMENNDVPTVLAVAVLLAAAAGTLNALLSRAARPPAAAGR